MIADAHRHRVARAHEPVRNRLHAAEGAVGVVGSPGAAAPDFACLDRSIADRGIGIEAFVEGGQIHKRLEDRPELALCVLGTVEARFRGIATANHGQDCAAAVLDHHRGSLQVGRLLAFFLRQLAPSIARRMTVSANFLNRMQFAL